MNRFPMAVLVALLAAVQPALAQTFFAPQEGHWKVEGEDGPGSGLNLTVQGGKIGVSVFTFDQAGDRRWFIAVADLVGSRFEAPLQRAEGGTRIQDPFAPGQLLPTDKQLTLDFSSETTALLTLDGVSKPLRLLQFGTAVTRIPALLEGGFERQFPDLAGRWVIWERNAETGDRLHAVEFEQAPRTLEEPPGVAAGWIDTNEADPERRIGVFCFTSPDTAPADTPDCLLRLPAPGGHRDLPLAANDIGLTRFAAKQPNRGVDGLEVVLAHTLRLPVAADRMRPETGHYTLVGESGPGSGINLVPRSEVLGLSVFTFAASGDDEWFTAAGAYPGSAGIELPLRRATGGTPIDAPFAPGVSEDTGSTIRLDFTFRNRGTMVIDGQRKELQKLIFGVPVSELPSLTEGGQPTRFPSLSGRWMLLATADGKVTDQRVLDLVPADATVSDPRFTEAVAWQNGEQAVPRDDEITLVCGNDRLSFIIPFRRCLLRGNVFPALGFGELLDFSPDEISVGRFDIPIFQIQLVGIPTIEVFALRID